MRNRLIALAFMFMGVAHAATLDENAWYPEGPLWKGDTLFYTEMRADRVSRLGPHGKETFWSRRGCGPTSLAHYGGGTLVLCHIGKSLVALGPDAKVKRIWSRDASGQEFQDPNDSYADKKGGVYFSDPGLFWVDAPATGLVYYLSPDGKVRRVAQELRYPNGVFVDERSQTLFVDEHLARRVLRYRIQADGSLADRQVFADINLLTPKVGDYPEAGPDGLEIGPDGNLYVCLYGEGRVLKLSPEGALLGQLKVRTPYVTNIAFGPDRHAYIVGSHDVATPPEVGEVMKFPLSAWKPR
jgi:gluconolactonase